MDLSQTALVNIGTKQLGHRSAFVIVDCVTSILGALVIGLVAWVFEAPKLIIGLAAIPFMIACVRWMMLPNRDNEMLSSASIQRANAVLNFWGLLQALSWGAIAAYLVHLNLVAVAVPAAGLAIVNAIGAGFLYEGAAGTTAVAIFLALAPPIASAAMRFDQLTTGMFAGFVAAAITAVFGARAIRRSTRDYVLSCSENALQHDRLQLRETEIERLNVALKTNIDKCAQAEGELRRTATDLNSAEEKMNALAASLESATTNCEVTGLANQRYFGQELELEWRRAVREQKPLSLVLLKVDEFDAFAKAFGEATSFTLLKRIGQSLKGFARRSGDLAGRYEIHTLGLMLPNCSPRNARRIAEALRKRVEKAKIPNVGAQHRETLSVHIGVATVKPLRSMSSMELMTRCETALAEANFQGGNRVVFDSPLAKLKLIRWQSHTDGALNEQSLTQKMLVWGYDFERTIVSSGQDPENYFCDGNDTVLAPLNGSLVVEVDGHQMTANAGDCVTIPDGLAVYLSVAGEHDVTKITASKVS